VSDSVRIKEMLVTPIACPDPPLLNHWGVHEPVFLRAIVRLRTEDGREGVGEGPGGGLYVQQLRAAARHVVGADAYHLEALRVLIRDPHVFSTIEVPGDVPVVLSFQLDGRVLTFTALVSVASAVLFGLVPALQSTKTNLVSALKAVESDQIRTRFFGRHTLVVAQVAGSLVLLVVATQLSRGFVTLLAASPGFRTDHLITMRIDPTLAGYSPVQIEEFYKTLTERAREVPGVRSAALSFSLPMTAGFRTEAMIPEGYQFPRDVSSVVVFTDAVDDDYFETFGVGVLQGRGFLPTDRADSPVVAVVNEVFARRYLGKHPIGRRIRLNDERGRWAEIVGVTVAGSICRFSSRLWTLCTCRSASILGRE